LTGLRGADRTVGSGAAGTVVAPDGKVTTVMAFTVRNGKITDIHILADPARLRQLNPNSLHGR